jgi:hypothetical protein
MYKNVIVKQDLLIIFKDSDMNDVEGWSLSFTLKDNI